LTIPLQVGRPPQRRLVLDGDVDEAVGVDHRCRVDVTTGPVVEDDRCVAVANVGDVQPHDPAPGVGEVDPLVEHGDGRLDGDVAPGPLDEEVVVAGHGHESLRVDGYEAYGAVGAIQHI